MTRTTTNINPPPPPPPPSHQLQPAITAPPIGITGTPHHVTWNHNYGGSGPCKNGNLHHGLKRDTCRYEANLEDIYDQDYAIVATAHVPEFAQGSQHIGGKCKEDGTGNGSCSPRLEITSGGPGSSGSDTCCGFSMTVNNSVAHCIWSKKDMGHRLLKVEFIALTA